MSKDFSRVAPGEMIGLGQAQHDDDRTSTGPQAGGAVQSQGQGGDRVWKDALLPEEKAVLKRYFD